MSRIVFALLAFVVLSSGWSSEARSFGDETSEGKVERRGFKSSLLSTARGFGKRSSPQSRISEERVSIPIEVLAEEIIRDPKLLAVIFQTLDIDDNGMVTPDEVAVTQAKMSSSEQNY